MKYVEWPEEESTGDFIVGLSGDSKIKEDLIVLANNKKLKGRKIVFKVFDKVEDITYCHLIYVSSSKSSSIKIINKLIIISCFYCIFNFNICIIHIHCRSIKKY